MVTIIDFVLRQSEEGKNFCALVLQGGIEMVQSKETGRYYATAKKTTIASTFDETTCQSLVGEKIPGQIVKEICEPYSYTIQDTGEVVELSHRWVYQPDAVEVKPVYQGKVEQPLHVDAF